MVPPLHIALLFRGMMVVTPLSSFTNFIISLIQDFYYVYDELIHGEAFHILWNVEFVSLPTFLGYE
jgi:hypothetical protein